MIKIKLFIPIKFRNYEILKTISEQLRLLAWAVGGIYGILSHKFGTIPTVIYTVYHWVVFQYYSIYVLNMAQKYKKE